MQCKSYRFLKIFSQCRSSSNVTQIALCHTTNKKCSFCLSSREAMTSSKGGVYILKGRRKYFSCRQKAVTINKNMADLPEHLQEIIVLLTIKIEQTVERNNNNSCNHWLAALRNLKYFLFVFSHFRTFRIAITK